EAAAVVVPVARVAGGQRAVDVERVEGAVVLGHAAAAQVHAAPRTAGVVVVHAELAVRGPARHHERIQVQVVGGRRADAHGARGGVDAQDVVLVVEVVAGQVALDHDVPARRYEDALVLGDGRVHVAQGAVRAAQVGDPGGRVQHAVRHAD